MAVGPRTSTPEATRAPRVVAILLLVVGLALPLLPAAAQVSMDDREILLSNSFGDELIELSTAPLGPDGCPSVRLRDPTSGNIILVLGSACQGLLILGGGTAGSADGSFTVRDTDGVTDTIVGNGEFGSLTLGSATEDGDLVLMDATPVQEGFNLDGNTGNATNQLGGNGFVKAWARINADGSIFSCWRCNEDTSSTYRNGTGDYFISFSPLGSNITGRPRTATIDSFSTGVISGMIALANIANDTVAVTTRDINGTLADRSFTVVIY